jgi:hypothetical protein
VPRSSRTQRAIALALLTLATPALATPVLAASGSVGEPTRAVGVNLAPAKDYQSGWVFVDVMRTARPWLSQTTQAPGGPWDTGAALSLTANGWPASLESGQAASTLMCREIDGRYPAGRYVCLYEGEGTIEFGFDAKVVSKGPGRMELEVIPSEGGIFMTIKATNPADPIRNVRVIMPGFEQTYTRQVFHPRFIESLQPFSTIRFMDWGSTNNSSITSWGDRTGPTYYTQQSRGGVAVELMAELCNQLNADGWFCVPHGADDEYVREMARTIAAHLEPGRRAYIEYSNEVWNGGFKQYHYAVSKATELGFADQPWTGAWRWTAQRSVEIFDIMDDVLGPDRLVRVLAGQAAVPDVLQTMIGWNDAGLHADVIAIAPYFSGKAAEPAYYPEVLGWSVDRVLDEASAHLLKVQSWVKQHAALAQSHGLRLVGYEGGQHLAPIGGTPAFEDTNFHALMTQANRSARMRDLYYGYLWIWHDAGGEQMCLFNHISEPTKFGSWGLLEYQDQPWSEAPKWHGVVEYMIDYDAFNKGQDLSLLADLDGDGILTNNDIAVFVQFFVAQDARADMNGDGVLDFSDVTGFVEAFVAG